MRTVVLLFLASSISNAQLHYFEGSSYDAAIPTPRQVLGYELGERFSDYRGIEKYVDALVSSSKRARKVIYGRTYESRPLQVILISSEENLAAMDAIREKNLKLTDPRSLKSQAEADRIVNSNPAVVWLSYGVHGNEASSPEAAMMTAYQLCAGTDQRTRSLLDQLIIVMDPLVNPDGHERYVGWVNSALGRHPNSNPEAIEHHEPWPGGRVNHYYFDLNRDWSWVTQQETKARLKLYRQWMPQVHVDFHEMGYGSTYFFFPAAVPFHEEFPDQVMKWGKIFGKGNADAFDRHAIPYYTGEFFDLFYPGYGDSWPSFNGATGMTYEQAGHAMGGLAIRKPSGEILTLRDRIRNHFISGMATLETTLKHKTERLKDFYDFWQSALKPTGPFKGFVIKEAPDPNRAAKMVSVLLEQGIEVHRLKERVQVSAKEFFSSKPSRESFPEGSYVIDLEQPARHLAAALLEPVTAAQDTFFYDVSAWSMPVAYGLSAYTIDTSPSWKTERLSAPPKREGSVIGGKAGFAYLIPWEEHDAVKLVWRLLDRGIKLSYTLRSFELSGRSFRPGTILAFTQSNSDSLHDIVASLAKTTGIEVHATNTGLTEKGINLGSNYVRPLRQPNIAILTDRPVDANDYGELWFMFEQEYEIPFTGIRAGMIGDVRLEQFDVLILPHASDYSSVIDSSLVDRLQRWVNTGGVLVGIEGGARFLTKGRSAITSAMLETDLKEGEKSQEQKDRERKKKEEVKRQSLFEKEQSDRLGRIPGTIFKALIDTTHPIGFGFERETYVFKGNGPSILLPEKGHTVVRFSSDTASTSGYAPGDRAKNLADSAFLLDFVKGDGRVVLIAEDITFRMFWLRHQKLLLNTVLFLPQRN